MDADNRGFLLVLSRNAYFTTGCGMVVVMLLGSRVTCGLVGHNCSS
jgi:hypothetical protein